VSRSPSHWPMASAASGNDHVQCGAEDRTVLRPAIALRSGARLPPFPTGEMGRPASGASALSSRAEAIQP
jgi:hypothetical protein